MQYQTNFDSRQLVNDFHSIQEMFFTTSKGFITCGPSLRFSVWITMVVNLLLDCSWRMYAVVQGSFLFVMFSCLLTYLLACHGALMWIRGVEIIISVVVLVNNNTEIEAYYYGLLILYTSLLRWGLVTCSVLKLTPFFWKHLRFVLPSLAF